MQTALPPTNELLSWYRSHRRELPWRPTADRPANPYHVLVSEAMLQQTQVATVIAYFQRFIEQFPTVESLAGAQEQQVLKQWQGLGYYRRARNLHAAAQIIVEQHANRVPTTVDELLKLPGVGRYTAGAIASIAHNQPAPILDGNVARVLSRYMLIDTPIDQPDAQKQLWQTAESLVKESGHPQDFNQAMMELGALVCTPQSPTCMYCPLREGCGVFSEGRVDELPIKTPKKPPIAVVHTVLAVKKRGQYLFEQRPASGLWSNMWQMPTVQGDDDATLGSASLDVLDPVRWISSRFGIRVSKFAKRDEFSHQTTHRSIRFVVYQAEFKEGRLRARTGQWRSLKQLDDLPLAKPQQSVIEMLRTPAASKPRR